MAKKKARKKQPKKQPAATAAVEAPQVDIPIERLLDDANEMINEYYGYDTAFAKQKQRVDELEAKLQLERMTLEHLAGPLVVIKKMLTPEGMKRISETRPWDGELKKELGRIELKKSPHGYGKKTAPTGAKSWAELKKIGASDDQIGKNLSTIPHRYGSKTTFHLFNFDFIHRAGEHYGSPETKLIAGKAALINEARRVFGIPQPTKAAAKAPAKKPPTARTKKPAAKKKSSKPAKKIAKKRAGNVAQKSPAKKKSSKRTVKQPITIVEQYSGAKPKAKKSSATKSTKSKRRSKQEVSKAVVEQLGLPDVEAESKELDTAYALLKNYGPCSTAELADRGELSINGADRLLKKLRMLGRAAVSAVGVYYVLEPAAAAEAPEAKPSKKKPAGVELEVTPEQQRAKLGASLKNEALDLLKERGPMSSTTLAGLLNLTVDAAGAKLRRLEKKKQVKKNGDFYELVDKLTPNLPNGVAADDVRLNDDFEQAIRDRGKKRNEVRKDFGGEEPIDELAAGEKSLAEEREFTEKFGDTSQPVVVDRKKQATKDTVRNPRATPFARTPK